MRYFVGCLYFILVMATSCHGQDVFVMEGAVGKYPVVMMLKEYKNDLLAATYFYKRDKYDIELTGRAGYSTDSLVLFKGKDDFTKGSVDTIEAFYLKKVNKATWEGEWRNGMGTRLPVHLSKVDSAQYDFSQVHDFDFLPTTNDKIYTQLRLSDIAFVKDSITYCNGYALEWCHDPRTKIDLFRVKTGYADTLLYKINKVLLRQHLFSINSVYVCTGMGKEKGLYEYGVVGVFMSAGILSVQASAFWICGGAHPENGSANFTVDTRSGEEIESLDDLCWFTGKKPPRENDAAYFNYIEERTKVIMAILKQLYPEQMQKPSEDSSNACNYSDEWVWKFPSWFLTEKGLQIYPTFPHAERSCGYTDFSLIPYSKLSPYLNKGIKRTLPAN